MLIIENIILAITSLLSNKMRALLTMLGIIIGIGSVIAILTVGDSITLAVSEKMQSMGANDIYVLVQPRKTEKTDNESKILDGVVYGDFKENSFNINEDDLIDNAMVTDLCNELKDEIYAINAQYQIGSTNVSNMSNETSINVLGVNVGYFLTNEKDILYGRNFTQEEFEEGKNVALVADTFIEDLYGENYAEALGKEIEVNVEGNIAKFSIIGIYEQVANYAAGMMMGGSATDFYIPLKSINTCFHQDLKFQYIQVISKVGVNPDELSGKVENFFNKYYRNNPNVEASTFTMTSMVSMMEDMLSTITVAISVIGAISLVVGGIGVMNIMLVSVTERTREIGTRKALGARNSSIRTQFIVEAMIICLVGGAIGVVVGIIGGIVASNLLDAPAVPSISAIIISLTFSMSIGIFFGYYPANKAAKMNPIDALRYE